MPMDASAATAISIYILKHGPDYLVRPALAVAAPGARLRFANLTPKLAYVFFPHEAFKGVTLRVEPEGSAELVVPEVRERGAFPYAVYSEAAREFCRGESSPIVIVEK